LPVLAHWRTAKLRSFWAEFSVWLVDDFFHGQVAAFNRCKRTGHFMGTQGWEYRTSNTQLFVIAVLHPSTLPCPSSKEGFGTRLSTATASRALRQHPIPSFAEAKHIIDDYIHFYNYERIQLKTKQTPYETRCLFS
jgi:hypothetical protein